MSLVSRFLSTEKDADMATEPQSSSSYADGALDTLSNVIRVMGAESFPLDSHDDVDDFPQVCNEYASHIENGAAVPSHDIAASVDGSRQWARVRRFFSKRRRDEKNFVTESLQDYRGVVDDLVSGLRDIFVRDQNTESTIVDSLKSIEDAVGDGALPKIKEALSNTINEVNETFAQQKLEYEQQLNELNERMSCLRQDLSAAHEEMNSDALTSAFNRGAFNAAIAQSVNMHFVLRQPATLLMVDLDEFKTVNDTYGHTAGDAVLKAVGDCLARSFIRKNDFIARYGGDEFAVILSDTSASNSSALIERFLESVRAIEVPAAGATIGVTCSVGYTEITLDDDVESFVHRADQALYQVKAEGRNGCAMLTAKN